MRNSPSGAVLPRKRVKLAAQTIAPFAQVSVSVTYPGALPGDCGVACADAPGTLPSVVSAQVFCPAVDSAYVLFTNMTAAPLVLSADGYWNVLVFPAD